MLMTKNCIRCGRKFRAKGNHQIYCSKECCSLSHYKYQKKKYEIRNCVICGKSYSPKYHNQITCLGECREKQREKMGLWFAFALFFGLLRGLAFAPHFNASVGQRNKMLPSLEVALGIEAGQLLVVLIVLILAFLLQTLFRFNKRDWILVISSIVLGLAIPLLLANWIF